MISINVEESLRGLFLRLLFLRGGIYGKLRIRERLRRFRLQSLLRRRFLRSTLRTIITQLLKEGERDFADATDNELHENIKPEARRDEGEIRQDSHKDGQDAPEDDADALAASEEDLAELLPLARLLRFFIVPLAV